MGTSNQLSREQTEAYLRALPSAWVAVEWHGAPHLIAAPFQWIPGASIIRLPRLVAEHLPRAGVNAAVCADEGRWFFDLRGIHLKGALRFAEYADDDAIFHLAEDRVRGWDMRLLAGEVTDLAAPGDDPPLARARSDRDGIIRIATLSAGGRPHITPIWYAHTNARYYAQTAEGALLVRNIRANPQVAAAVSHNAAEPWYPATYLVGTARFSRGFFATVPGKMGVGGYYFMHPGALANWARYRRGLRRLPSYFSRRDYPGIVTIDAEVITEVYSPEGVAGEWLTFVQGAPTA